jgi:hypothetical protein
VYQEERIRLLKKVGGRGRWRKRKKRLNNDQRTIKSDITIKMSFHDTHLDTLPYTL